MAISDNIDAIKGYATTAAQTAAKKARMLTSIAKANLSILAEEDKVRKAQLELGKVYYKDYILGEEPDEAEYIPLCDKITESLKIIDNLKTQIELSRQAETDEAEEAAPEAAPEAAEEALAEPEIPEIVVVEDAAEEAPAEAPAEEAPVEEAPADEAPAEE